jgi:hypothetical protein
MPDIPRWLEELRRQPLDAPTGNMAVLRDIIRSCQARRIDGVKTPPQAAELMLRVYDRLAPQEQELFAAECNTDFRACARKCLAAEATGPLTQLLSDLLGGMPDGTDDQLHQVLSSLLAGASHFDVTVFVMNLGQAVRKKSRRRSDRGDNVS